ncbi:UNVERIFIED_CONTAM: hypothetical protein NCL1_59460 [Trichonephila clavipes]
MPPSRLPRRPRHPARCSLASRCWMPMALRSWIRPPANRCWPRIRRTSVSKPPATSSWIVRSVTPSSSRAASSVCRWP